MSADQFLTLDGRPTVRVERRYPHPIERVWRAVTTPEHLGQWFPSPVEVDLRPGGVMRFGAFNGVQGETGTVEAVDPPRHLKFMWGTDRMTFELAPDGDGTKFALTHSFDDRYGAPSFATGWEICMAGLRCVLAGEPLPPRDWGTVRHEELVREFGLDRPEVTEVDGSWTVRVERQLTCPAEVAWDLWFGKDRDTGEQRTAGVGADAARLTSGTTRSGIHPDLYCSAPTLPGADARLVALGVGENPERGGSCVGDEGASGRECRGNAMFGDVVRDSDIDVDAVALRARGIHLLEPERRGAAIGIDAVVVEMRLVAEHRLPEGLDRRDVERVDSDLELGDGGWLWGDFELGGDR